ncbi:hypothetical protein [Parahaliea aestuarii]|uniref:Phosphodiester glycosidase domain-containing protein n=1 Tax=Parahaliea aestuarii TaxID=1852021 RepID=A0A5C8ZSL5_9GAMM|nr:hypothetical protein [Parahaliea aestuarii]TXS90457.1 hypothetical protein FVW59_14035 [Parahaliea aestuarii]
MPVYQRRWSAQLCAPLAALLVAAGSVAVAERDLYRQPFSSQSPWNVSLGETPYGDAAWEPLDLGEQAHVHINSNSWSIPFYLAADTTPERPIYIRKLEDYVEAPVPEDARPAEGTDGHLAVMSADRTTIHEFFRYDEAGQADIYRRLDAPGTGVAERPGWHIGTRAYGGSSVGGLIRRWELDAGRIDHALAVALSLNFLKRGFVPPATTEDANSEKNYTGHIPMGALLRLPADLQPEEHLERPLALLIARALQTHGAYVVDSGGSNALLFYAEPGFDDDLVAASANELDRILPLLQWTTPESGLDVGGFCQAGERPAALTSP